MPPRPYRHANRRERDEDADRDWERYDEQHEHEEPRFYQAAYVRGHPRLMAFRDTVGREYYHITAREFEDLYIESRGGADVRFICVVPRGRDLDFPAVSSMLDGRLMEHDAVYMARADVSAEIDTLRAHSRFTRFASKYPASAEAVRNIMKALSVGRPPTAWRGRRTQVLRSILRYARRSMRRAIRERNDTAMFLLHGVASAVLARYGRMPAGRYFQRVLDPFDMGSEEWTWATSHWDLAAQFAPLVRYRARAGANARARVTAVENDPDNLVGVVTLRFEGEAPVPSDDDDDEEASGDEEE